MLVILDGWGLGEDPERSAIAQANTPYFDGLWADHPHSQLLTHGTNVGLPEGQMGNSEVGHLNIGAGRVVYQDLMLINRAIENGDILENSVFQELLSKAKTSKKRVHILGLLSDGGVHSHVNHLLGILDIFETNGIDSVFIHGFLDGRDTDPNGGRQYVAQIEEAIKHTSAHLASLVGRYYAMDRDRRWERVKTAYDLLVNGVGEERENFEDFLEETYKAGTTDEFVHPVKKGGANFHCIQDDDIVFFYNFRTDRPRQLTEVLTQSAFPELEMKPLALSFYTMTEYDKHFKKVKVLFKKEVLSSTFGEVIANEGLSQLRAAETEKYPHVTYFFNGGKEEALTGEERILINSPKVATYDMQPEMSAYPLTEAVMTHIEGKHPSAVVINYANADMVGHTGDFDAAIQAVEAVDKNLKLLCELALNHGYKIVIIADHGNADYMINDDGSVNTAHSTNPVPCILLGGDEIKLKDGILADVAPTLLDLMGIVPPKSMTGTSLLAR